MLLWACLSVLPHRGLLGCVLVRGQLDDDLDNDLDDHFLSLVASLLAADAFGLPLARGAVASRGGPHGRDDNAMI